jgi:tRNA/rRNA methyltransferase
MWPPVLVCHQLRFAENLGSVARVMANFGCRELILSEPVTHDFRGMERTGVGAESVLSTFSVASTLPEALSGVVFALGTSSRVALKRQQVVTPQVGVRLLFEHSARGKVALVLGGEKRGLSDDELAHCHAVVAIETSDVQPSMNLAQAAAVLLYLCSQQGATHAKVPAKARGATGQVMQRLERLLQQVLEASEFVNPQAPRLATETLLRTLVRNELSADEAALWVSALTHVKRHVR